MISSRSIIIYSINFSFHQIYHSSTLSHAQVLKLLHALFNALTHQDLGERSVTKVDIGLVIIHPNHVVRVRVNLIAEWLFIKGLIETLIPQRLLSTLQLHECINRTIVTNAIRNQHCTYYHFLSCRIRFHTDTSSHAFLNDWNFANVN